MHAPNCMKAGMVAYAHLSRYKYCLTEHAGRVLPDTVPAKTAQKESHHARVPKHSRPRPRT
jgi:sRNA-binding protein